MNTIERWSKTNIAGICFEEKQIEKIIMKKISEKTLDIVISHIPKA